MNIDKLYEAFGELVYAVAKADGVIQDTEVARLKEMLRGYSGADDIIWSFNYEQGKEHDLKHAYEKALDVMIQYGPFEDYPKLIEILKSVAEASDGIDDNERILIERFEDDLQRGLRNRFEK